MHPLHPFIKMTGYVPRPAHLVNNPSRLVIDNDVD
jgi:hypothetical protein